jgi:hypothetical protein
VNYNFNLEKTPLELKTDSASGSGEQVDLWLLTGQGAGFKDLAGSFMLHFQQKMQYRLGLCNGGWTDFPSSSKIPSTSEKVWRVTLIRISDVRVRVHCNEEEVLDITLSDKTCGQGSWKKWRWDLTKIQFTRSLDTASDFYRPYTGNIR